MKKNLIGLLISFSFVFLVVVILLGKSIIGLRDIEDGLPQIGIGNVKFPVESVTEVTLEVDKSKFILRKSARNFIWDTPFNPKVIKLRLTRIATLKGVKVAPFKNIKGIITLRFNNGKRWKGVFNQYYFRWVSGPFKGEGGRLSNKDHYLFSSGKYFFKAGDMSWCSSNIRSIKGKSERTGDFLGIWTDSNCSTSAEVMIDPEFYAPKKFPFLANIEYQNLSKATLEWNHDGLFRLKENGKEKIFLSKNLFQNIKKLNLNPLEGLSHGI